MKMMKKYQKPAVSTIDIPERSSFACNMHHGRDGCPTGSNIIGFGGGNHHHPHHDDDHHHKKGHCD